MDWAKKHSGLTVYFIDSNTVWYPCAAEHSPFSWHTLVEATMTASWRPAEPGSRPELTVQRWRCEEDRNNLLRSQTPVITYQPLVEFCNGDIVCLSHTGICGAWWSLSSLSKKLSLIKLCKDESFLPFTKFLQKYGTVICTESDLHPDLSFTVQGEMRK